jgi:uncharacterized membrane protein YgcG
MCLIRRTCNVTSNLPTRSTQWPPSVPNAVPIGSPWQRASDIECPAVLCPLSSVSRHAVGAVTVVLFCGWPISSATRCAVARVDYWCHTDGSTPCPPRSLPVQVYAETLNWDRAVVRYEAAVALERAAGNDVAILEGRLAHARTSLARQQQLVTFAVPGGAGVGAFLGLLLLIADVYSPQPHLQHWMLRLITVIIAAAFGAATGGVYIYFDDLKRQSYLLEFKTAGKGGASGSAATGVGGASSSAGQSSGSEGASSTKQQRVRRKVDKKPPWVKSPTGPSKTST